MLNVLLLVRIYYDMKKKVALALVLLLALPLLLVGCGKNEQKLNFYCISAQYDDGAHTLSCEQDVEYVNNSDNALDKVCFYLYANSFAQKDIVSKSYFDRAFPNGESKGNIQFSSVSTAQNNDPQYEISQNGAILTVFLPKELFPDESVNIHMEYVVNLANINHRLGYGNNAVNFGNFFPIACVYEKEGFVLNDFALNGDPFYSDVSNFEVTIECDEDFVVASSGQQTQLECESTGNKKILCKTQKTRDFCFVLSKKFEKISQNLDGVTINYFYYDDENAKHHLETSVNAVKLFSEKFTKYPYEQLSVVKTNFCFGGMEYPNLVMISDDINEKDIDYVIAHEIAHQWWYGLVGNNQFENAWIDEGLTEFSTALFFENYPQYGLKYQEIMDNAQNSYKNFVRIYEKIYEDLDESMDRKLTEFSTEPEYVYCTYTKGMLLFDSLRKTLKDKKFFKCLKKYCENFSYQNVSEDELVSAFSKYAGMNLSGYFASWTNGTVVFG